jgi:hypothetical protein
MYQNHLLNNFETFFNKTHIYSICKFEIRLIEKKNKKEYKYFNYCYTKVQIQIEILRKYSNSRKNHQFY